MQKESGRGGGGVNLQRNRPKDKISLANAQRSAISVSGNIKSLAGANDGRKKTAEHGKAAVAVYGRREFFEHGGRSR